jgi:uncharacterized protein DUF1360
VNFRLSPTELLIAVLAVWRITHLLWGEDGPFELLLRLRKLAGRGFVGELLDCFYCLSLWIAIPFAWVMGNNWPERLVLWLSFSGGAILLERATVARTPPAAEWSETPNGSSSVEQ